VRGLVVRLGIIGAIALGALVFRDRLSANAGELAVGDCFDDPAGAEIVTDVQHHPCTEAHTAEVVFLGKLTGDNATYPSDQAVEDWVLSNCVPAWNAYTGKDLQTETVLTMGWYQPAEDGWSDGDRDMICYASRDDGGRLTSSVRAGS